MSDNMIPFSPLQTSLFPLHYLELFSRSFSARQTRFNVFEQVAYEFIHRLGERERSGQRVTLR
jgi:hypothetical protein